MKLHEFGLALATLLLAMSAWVTWVEDTWDCWLHPGTDTCVGCVDDCLEPREATMDEEFDDQPMY